MINPTTSENLVHELLMEQLAWSSVDSSELCNHIPLDLLNMSHKSDTSNEQVDNELGQHINGPLSTTSVPPKLAESTFTWCFS